MPLNSNTVLIQDAGKLGPREPFMVYHELPLQGIL